MKKLTLISVSIFLLTNLIYPQDIINETGTDGKFIVRDAEQQEAMVIEDGNVGITGELSVEQMPEGSVGNPYVVWDPSDKKFKTVARIFSKLSPLSEPLETRSWHSFSSDEVDEDGNLISASVQGVEAINWNRFDTDHGYIQLGPANTTFAHIYTDRSRFMFNKGVTFYTGEFGTAVGNDLKLQAGGVTRLIFKASNGNVGIGTLTPEEKLHIAGNMRLNGTFEDKDGDTGAAGQVLSSTGAGTDWILPTSGPADNLGNHTATQNIILNSNWLSGDGGNEGLFVNSSGKVGIGTTNPSSMLSVGHGGFSNTGIYSYMTQENGIAVSGNATAAYGFGIYGQASDDNASAVYGYATNATGTVYGIKGKVNSENGWAGYFDGRGYFRDNVGIGVINPTEKLDVNGTIKGTGLTINGSVVGSGFTGWDTNASDDLTTASILAGDVTGTFGATSVGNDSHNHTDATVGDNITINNGRLYAPTGSGNVGIGTTDPGTSKLKVLGAGGSALSLKNADGSAHLTLLNNSGTAKLSMRLFSSGSVVGIYGNNTDTWISSNTNGTIPTKAFVYLDNSSENVGIGTMDPGTSKLNVIATGDGVGALTLQNTDGPRHLQLMDNGGTMRLSIKLYASSTIPGITANNNDTWISSNTNGTIPTKAFVYLDNSSENVGIGTTTPAGKLDVNGTIYQRSGQLHADYVFEDDYDLESIQEHSDFMWTEKHLKAIPKSQIDENGLEIVEVGAHRKGIVEELEKAHIYISDLEERIRHQESSLDDLAKRIENLESN